LQFDLSSIAPVLRECRQCQKTAVEMADRLAMGGAVGGTPASLQPLIDGARGIAGRCQMMREEFWLALDEIGETLLQHCGDAGVQFLSPRAEQSAVGGVQSGACLKR